MKRAFTVIVLLFLAGSVVFVFTDRSPIEPAATSAIEPNKPTSGLFVYYFDMGKDCSTCLQLEAYTHETLETYFSDALASGEIRWETVDVDRLEHGHFVEEFGLYTKSVVLATREDGELVTFNNLSRIWELVYDKESYIDYVRTQVDEALGTAP